MTVAYKTAVEATDFVHCASLWPVNLFPEREQTVYSSQWFEGKFAPKIQQHTVASDKIMVSFDVKSLFTSIPVDLANERLQKDQDLAERTNMSISNIMRLLDFVFNHNYFKLDIIHYKHVFGCAMGSPISPVIADLLMEEIEGTAIAAAPHPPN